MIVSNDFIHATFSAEGAELTSLKANAIEYIWQADPAFWGRHAPVLFPFVGRLKENTYTYEGRAFELGQHGFARNRMFEVVRHVQDEITFRLRSDDQSQQIYPFSFTLDISYRLEGRSLLTSYSVTNEDTKEMYFSIGGHPGLVCPLAEGESRSDYWLEFENEEPFITHLLGEDGLFSGDVRTVDTEGGKIMLEDTLFDNDALVFKGLKSTKVTLASASKKWLAVSLDGFPYLGIWSKSQDSPFVCIEPWYGLADSADHDGDIKTKEGIMTLAPSKRFGCRYAIDIL